MENGTEVGPVDPDVYTFWKFTQAGLRNARKYFNKNANAGSLIGTGWSVKCTVNHLIN